MRAYDLIEKKKRGGELTEEELRFLINGYLDGSVPDYQMSAFLMAVYFTGMSEAETLRLTEIMRDSGDVNDLSVFGDAAADKHSTGGVGDNTSLIVAPVCASLGAVMAKMSGRGLGHTGGTVDKLESIPGYRSSLSSEEFFSQVKDIGIALTGQSGNLTPADKKLYALRDVTATVDSIPLIASSIMSKKLASGAHNIVLDVKTGSGAFMKDRDSAEALARAMVKIGKGCGRNTSAVISNMDRPLGSCVGNALEVWEAYRVLKGTAGEMSADLKELSLVLSAEIIRMVKGISFAEAEALAAEALCGGSALKKFEEWIEAQGGDISFLEKEESILSALPSYEVKAPFEGYIRRMNAETVGKAAAVLGAGRERKEDSIDLFAGIVLYKKTQ